jgi:hypothetical protein
MEMVVKDHYFYVLKNKVMCGPKDVFFKANEIVEFCGLNYFAWLF